MTPTPVAVAFTTPDGLTLRGDEFLPTGSPSATALMLHGGGQTRHSWKATGAQLAAAGIRVITLDSRGHGDSDWSADGVYSVENFADDAQAAVAAIGGPVTLIGASMGGLTGIAVADRLGPDGVTAVILVDVVPRFDRAGSGRIRDFMLSGIGGFESLEQAADAVAAYLPHRERPRSTAGLERNLRQRADGKWYWHWDPRFIENRTGYVIPADSLEDAAARLTVPIMLIRGKLSDVVSEDAVAQFCARVPGVAVAELGDAGHTAAGDDNDAFTAAVLTFVQAANVS